MSEDTKNQDDAAQPPQEPAHASETPTQKLDKDGQPLEPPPGHGGRPQVE